MDNWFILFDLLFLIFYFVIVIILFLFSSDFGQGHGDKTNRTSPCLVESLQTTRVFVEDITCGWSHTVALSQEGELWSWGNGDHGKLGHGTDAKQLTPLLLSSLSHLRCVGMASYNEHTIAMTTPRGCDGKEEEEEEEDLIDCEVSGGYLRQMSLLVDQELSSKHPCLISHDVSIGNLLMCAFVVLMEMFGVIKVSWQLGVFISELCSLQGLIEIFLRFFWVFRMKESLEGVVSLPSTPKAVFRSLLNYLYTDSTLHIPASVTPELFILADMYQLGVLKVNLFLFVSF